MSRASPLPRPVITTIPPENLALMKPGEPFSTFFNLHENQPKFSAFRLPAVGEIFRSERLYFHHEPTPNERIPPGTELRVVGYFMEHGWLHVAALQTADRTISDDRIIFITGNEVAEWSTL